ncbi:type II toxin-antitoxin system VapC family toxin [Sorangium sp. So ce1078]|uniref:type II toxin-antitoxin system VapC family toxin n=1 Tax=Sorangium sp. So ce1078 TaxID=3133329 RepID=UPI003F6064CE
MRTFVDAGVLIVAARGTGKHAERALSVLGDPRREFVASALLKLEVLPKPLYFRRTEEVEFYETFFSAFCAWAPLSDELSTRAFSLASQHGLAGMDALHVAAALTLGAEEMVTTERETSPLFRARPGGHQHFRRSVLTDGEPERIGGDRCRDVPRRGRREKFSSPAPISISSAPCRSCSSPSRRSRYPRRWLGAGVEALPA